MGMRSGANGVKRPARIEPPRLHLASIATEPGIRPVGTGRHRYRVREESRQLDVSRTWRPPLQYSALSEHSADCPSQIGPQRIAATAGHLRVTSNRHPHKIWLRWRRGFVGENAESLGDCWPVPKIAHECRTDRANRVLPVAEAKGIPFRKHRRIFEKRDCRLC